MCLGAEYSVRYFDPDTNIDTNTDTVHRTLDTHTKRPDTQQTPNPRVVRTRSIQPRFRRVVSSPRSIGPTVMACQRVTRSAHGPILNSAPIALLATVIYRVPAVHRVTSTDQVSHTAHRREESQYR